jgi:hypothetical protein
MTEFLRLEEDASARRLAYVGALLLIIIPFLQAGQQLWPLQLGDIRWRFQAASALSSILLLPFSGLTVMGIMSRISGNTTVSRIVGALSAVFVIGLLGSLVLFAMDALQLKTIVNSAQTKVFQSTSLRVVMVTVTFAIAFSMLMVTAFQSARGAKVAKKAARKAEEGAGLIVGR